MTPEQEDQVRRVLAAVHRPMPIPADVAARLEAVLDDLTAPRVAGEPPVQRIHRGHPARLGRLGWGRPNLLVAAAAAGVIALAGAAVATRGFGRTEQATSSSSAAGSPAGGPGRSRALAPGGLRGQALAAVHTATLARDVQRLVDRRGAHPSGDQQVPRGCVAPTLGRGEELLAVLLDGRPGSLVLGVPDAGTREARVYRCSDSRAPVATSAVRSP